MEQQQNLKGHIVLKKIKESLFNNKQCIAAYQLGEISQNVVKGQSDLKIIVIVDDHYKASTNSRILEDDISVRIQVYEISAFKHELACSLEEGGFWYQFINRTSLFCKDISLEDFIEETYNFGEAQRKQELLIRFSGAVYYLNKVEKNLYVKENMENVMYFIPQLAENIAYIEVFLNSQILEAEIIPQAKRINPNLFREIYDPLFDSKASRKILEGMVRACVTYLESITRQVYEPIISYLLEHGNFDHFTYVTREFAFGINYEWLVRVGIAQRYALMDRVPIFKEQACTLGYQLCY